MQIPRWKIDQIINGEWNNDKYGKYYTVFQDPQNNPPIYRVYEDEALYMCIDFLKNEFGQNVDRRSK